MGAEHEHVQVLADRFRVNVRVVHHLWLAIGRSLPGSVSAGRRSQYQVAAMILLEAGYRPDATTPPTLQCQRCQRHIPLAASGSLEDHEDGHGRICPTMRRSVLSPSLEKAESIGILRADPQNRNPKARKGKGKGSKGKKGSRKSGKKKDRMDRSIYAVGPARVVSGGLPGHGRR